MFKRGKIWYFSINGTKESAGTSDKKRAEALERQRRQEAWDRANGFYVRTWDEACLAWLESHQHLASYPQNRIMARFWTEHLTGLKLNAITKELAHSLIVKHRPVNLAERIKANGTANNYVRFVEKIIRSGSSIEPNFQTYPEPIVAKRWLKREEWAELEAAMLAKPEKYEDLRHISTFALATGLRESNDMRFEWSWLHGASTAYLPRQVTKTAEDYGIPLNVVAQGIIEERRQAKVRHQKYVFTEAGQPWKVHRLLKALYRAVDDADIAPMTFHTFRHTFASWLAQQGVSDAVRKRLGCWSPGTDAASNYVHFDVESLRKYSEMVFPNPSQLPATVVDSESVSA